MSKNLKENKLDSYARKHVVLHKKGFIIGTVCAGLALAGAGGTAIYFGVTRNSNSGVVDNTITYEEANEFAKKNFKYSDDDLEEGKYDADSGLVSWDFTKTPNLDKEVLPDPSKATGAMIWHAFWIGSDEVTQAEQLDMFKFYDKILTKTEYDSRVKKMDTKGTNVESSEVPTKYDTSTENPAMYQCINKYNMVWYINSEGKKERDIFFFSGTHLNIRKNGDEISCDYLNEIFPKSGIKNKSTVTYKKDGRIKNVTMELYGFIDLDAFKLDDPFFDGTLSIDFNYKN